MPKMNLAWPQARQTPYPQSYCSSPALDSYIFFADEGTKWSMATRPILHSWWWIQNLNHVSTHNHIFPLYCTLLLPPTISHYALCTLVQLSSQTPDLVYKILYICYYKNKNLENHRQIITKIPFNFKVLKIQRWTLHHLHLSPHPVRTSSLISSLRSCVFP